VWLGEDGCELRIEVAVVSKPRLDVYIDEVEVRI
jgi:hypothetical protein